MAVVVVVVTHMGAQVSPSQAAAAPGPWWKKRIHAPGASSPRRQRVSGVSSGVAFRGPEWCGPPASDGRRGSNKKRNHLNQKVKQPDYKVAYVQLSGFVVMRHPPPRRPPPQGEGGSFVKRAQLERCPRETVAAAVAVVAFVIHAR
ncbi:hypothetical protein CRUP_018379 [Coryphaenoides rupestris]|nr:hypothetical protein CRUP_018379 [Coryphaenoides rupestris]